MIVGRQPVPLKLGEVSVGHNRWLPAAEFVELETRPSAAFQITVFWQSARPSLEGLE